MKILISGSTGLIGQTLGQALVEAGHTIVALTRHPEKSKLLYPAQLVQWEAEGAALSKASLQNVEAVIHLAGEGIALRRWTLDQKNKILNSRVKGSENLVQSIADHGAKVKLFISASGVSFYGFSEEHDQAFTEASPQGEGFLAEVSQQWEEPLKKLPPHIRNVIFRIAPVLTASGGFLGSVVPLFKKGLGGRLGSGKQWMCWIHIEDLILMITAALGDSSIAGIYNASASNIRNQELTQILCRQLGVFQSLPVPAFVLKALYGEMSQLLLCSQKVESKRWGSFQHQDLQKALQNLAIGLADA